MNITQISLNARQNLDLIARQEAIRIASDIESKYSNLVANNCERVVNTLITSATNGKNAVYINFDRAQFCCGIGIPSVVLCTTIQRIIDSNDQLAGVQFSVWNNADWICHFTW